MGIWVPKNAGVMIKIIKLLQEFDGKSYMEDFQTRKL